MRIRIKNGTFSIDGETSHIPANEHGGQNTLHGGTIGYDQVNWTVASHTESSLTLIYYDQAQQGFPGDLLNVATFTLEDDQSFTSRLVSIPLNDATPVMLSHHIYWNLGAFVGGEKSTILNNTLYLPYSKRYIQTDGILVPNGTLGVVEGTGLDFTKPGTKVGDNIPNTVGFCGTNCTGIDNAWTVDRPPWVAQQDPTLTILRAWSPETGIQQTVQTNQQGLQIFSCVNENGTIPVKKSQQHIEGQTTYIPKFGCMVIETQDWIDGINNPQWDRTQYQIASASTPPIVNMAKFTFSVVDA
jgi:aldose 1-epimerase